MRFRNIQKLRISVYVMERQDMAKQLAEEVFKVPIERFTYRAAGINHLTWFTDMKIDGKDVYPKLHDKLKESGFDKKEPISKQLYDIYGLYPAPGDRHVGEFFPYYMKEEVLMEQDYEWKNNDFKVVDGWREEARVLFDEVRTKKEGYEEFLKWLRRNSDLFYSFACNRRYF